MDLECYDFIKSYSAYGGCWVPEEHEFEGLPHRERMEVDILEEPTLCCTGRGHDEYLLGSELLLKLKLLVDLINIRRTRNVLAGRLLPELGLYVQREICASPLSLSWCHRGDAALQEIQHTLLWHVDVLRARLAETNRYIFRLHLGMYYDIDMIARKDADEYYYARMYCDSTGAAWHQIEGVSELLNAAHASAMQDRQLETVRASRKFDPRRQTMCGLDYDWDEVERIQGEDCVFRMWGHLEFVVTNAQSISTRRPSRLEYLNKMTEATDKGMEGANEIAASDDGSDKEVVDGKATNGDDATGVEAVGDAGVVAADEVAFADCMGAECSGCWECR
ncbi:hypothetical protein LTR95_011638 [Oleoguttula sp. CCFEE 5521]